MIITYSPKDKGACLNNPEEKFLRIVKLNYNSYRRRMIIHREAKVNPLMNRRGREILKGSAFCISRPRILRDLKVNQMNI